MTASMHNTFGDDFILAVILIWRFCEFNFNRQIKITTKYRFYPHVISI